MALAIKGSPFRGLAAFRVRHAPVFFGRSRDIARAVDRWKDAAERGVPFLLVVGASGSGKSSLARAGSVPRLTTPGAVPAVDQWRVAVLRPSEIPKAGTHARSAPARRRAGHPRFRCGSPGGAAGTGRQRLPHPVRAGLAARPCQRGGGNRAGAARPRPDRRRSPPPRWVRAAGAGRSDPARRSARGIVRGRCRLRRAHRFCRPPPPNGQSGRIWTLAILRADLYERFLAEPDLLALKSAGAAYDLAAPGPAELAEIVPSRRKRPISCSNATRAPANALDEAAAARSRSARHAAPSTARVEPAVGPTQRATKAA